MRLWKDAMGREWDLTVNVSQLRAVKAAVGVDLPALANDGWKGFRELAADPVRLVDVLYVLCRERAERCKISDDDFGRGMGGDSLWAAADALAEELVDFFPERTRAAHRRLLQVARQVTDLATKEAAAELEGMTAESIWQRWKSTLAATPGSLASPPGPSPSGS